MQVLISTSRMPCAIDEIRKLGSLGHTVVATDTFRAAPGSHSKYVAEAVITASPRRQTWRFVQEIADIVTRRTVDLILPAFEEVFYLAKHRALYPEEACFFPKLETLVELHDKARFLKLAGDLGLKVPQSAVVTDRAGLAEATKGREFFAKPVFSRGGVSLFTNVGVLAGAMKLEDCDVSAQSPWIVEDFVHGLDVCTFSVVQHGKVTGHSAYVHPREIEHAGGIVFESVSEPECLQVVRKIAEATGYHGQLSFDFMKTDAGMVLIECNPRPTAGVHVMPEEMFEEALLDKGGKSVRLAEAGTQRKYSVALVRDMLLHFREAWEDARYLFGDAKEVVAEPRDLLPALYQVLSYARVFAFRRAGGVSSPSTRLMAAYFDDVSFNGDEPEVRAP